MKTGIVIIVYNIQTEVFLLQIEAIRKFCKDDFVIEVFDNSSNNEIAEGIRYHSEILGISYKKTQANSLNGSDSHSFSANFSYDLLKDKFEYMFYIDHDCLPIREFSVVEILGEDKMIAGVGQHNGIYFWPGCVMWRNVIIDKDLIDFSPSHDLGLDTGSGLRKVIEEYGKDACIFFNEAYHQNDGFKGKSYNYYAVINNGMFLHFINGSNWNHVKNHENRMNSLLNIAREKINKNVG